MTGADGNSLAGTWSFTGKNIIPTVNNKGYQAVFTPDDADNYNTVTRTITVKVTKATPVIAQKPTAGALTYGQKLSDSTLTGEKRLIRQQMELKSQEHLHGRTAVARLQQQTAKRQSMM